jgi:hypothetical protein
MAIISYDGIIRSRAGGKAEDLLLGKTTSITPAAAAYWFSLLKCAGVPPAMAPAGVPGGAIMNRASVGAFPISNPTGSDKKYLLTFGASVPSVTGFSALMLVDILWMAGAVTVAASPITVNSPALTRYTNGLGNRITIAIDGALGAVAINPTVTYKNEASVQHAGTQIAIPASAAIRRLFPADVAMMTLASGDLGVTTVDSIALAGTTTGTIDIIIYHPIMIIPLVAVNTFIERDSTIQIDGLTELIYGSDSQCPCLGVFALSGGSSACATETMFIRTVAG